MERKRLYIFTLPEGSSERTYDITIAAEVMQGIFNRSSEADKVYVNSLVNKKPDFWLELFSREGGWMAEYERTPVGFEELAALTLPYLRGRAIWDTRVPATLNAATTIAGARDYIVLSPELDAEYAGLFGELGCEDLRGRFDGSVSGSAKNDVYRWAVTEFIDAGLCSAHWLCLYEDSASARKSCSLGYAVTRDWAVYNRAFVYDLSPWGDELPKDDPAQPLGCDLATYRLLLEAQSRRMGKDRMCEVAGFFSFWKYSDVEGFPSSHHPVATEWETVYLISPYNCYQNTVASDCYNQSFHSSHKIAPLKQGRPAPLPLENKCYVCIHMADYDSATPLYDFMPDKWINADRGTLPLCWGINPNLMESYPDIFEYLYSTKSENDWFVGDASAAGYFNPNRIKPESWELVTAHNKHFYELADMSVSPMVLDWEEPTPLSKDNFKKFSPDGYSTIIMDMHGNGGHDPAPHVWDGMTVDAMYNGACNWGGVEQTARWMAIPLERDVGGKPSFHMIRMVWITPTMVKDTLRELERLRPDLDIVPVDPYNYFRLLARSLEDNK